MLFRLILVAIFGISLADEPGCILTKGEHLDDLVKSAQGTVLRNAIVFFYRKRCLPTFEVTDFPPPQYMYVFTYDIDLTLEYTWYHPNPEDDLSKRYGITEDDCEVALFFQKGDDFDKVPARWVPSSDESLAEWSWGKQKVSVTLTNNLQYSILVSQEAYGNGPPIMPGTIAPGETLSIPSYPGYLVIGQTIEHQLTYFNDYTSDSDSSVTMTVQRPVIPIEDLKRRELSKHEEASDYQKATAVRHLAMLKQPLFVNRLSETGLDKVKMAPKLYKEIFNSYVTHFDEGEEPEYDDITAKVLNPLDQNAKHIPLPTRVGWAAVELMRPIIRKWCGSKVRYDGNSGIFIYSAGSRLFKSVAPIEKGGILVILNIDKNLASADDWPLEVIGPRGNTENITIEQGEMVMVEAARIIHGFPSTFKGKYYVNAYFHFTPNGKWPYTKEGSQYVNTDTGEAIDFYTDLMTPFTFGKRVPHDEL